jgi:hypothetical protein
VHIKENTVSEIPKTSPPIRKNKYLLPLRKIYSLTDELLLRPTFTDNFDGVVLDWKYLIDHERNYLIKEAVRLRRMQLEIVVDASSGINLFPDLTLVNNRGPVYSASLSTFVELIERMEIVGSTTLVVSLHRFPENNMTWDQAYSSIVNTLKEICARAKMKGINVLLRLDGKRQPLDVKNALDLLDKISENNFQLAPSVSYLQDLAAGSPDFKKLIDHTSKYLLVSGEVADITGKPLDIKIPFYKSHISLSDIPIKYRKEGGVIVLDGVYETQDEEYEEITFVQQQLKGS